MENWISGRNLLRLWLAAIASVCLVLIPASAALASNNGDVWTDNVGQPAGPGHEQDPHLACQDINLWGNGLTDSGGTYTIDGWPPSGSQEQDYSSTWSYDQSKGGDQVLDVISVKTLIDNAIANGDVPQANQGFHFKLEFSQDPQKHKTFWVNCAAPSITTIAASGSVGQPIHDQATLSGSNSATGTITWNIYSSSDKSCSNSLGTVSESVNGDGTYTSPGFTPSTAGSYQWVATYSGDSQNLSASTSCNDPKEQSTVSPATPSIATNAASGSIGQPITDQATLSGGYFPTGSITWFLYNSSDKSCSNSLGSVTAPVNGDGNYTSPSITPSSAGSYQWVAEYSGDSNNAKASTSCNDPKEQSTVAPGTPSINTNAASGSIGGSITDQATLSGGDNPTGSITWKVYSSSDKSCSNSLGSVTKSVSGDGTYTSPAFTPTSAGSYQWVAEYSGDGNNAKATTSCNDAKEQSTVSQVTPSISTSATSSVGGSIHDVATLSGGYNPTGTITWNVYTAGSCSAPLHTESVAVNGDGTYTSPDWTPPPGTYEWVATYSGDTNNTSVSTSCSDPNEQSTVQQTPAPSISLVKLEKDGTTGGSFTHGPITGNVGDTIDYQMTVVNTGNTSLVITFSDPHCDAGTLSTPTVLAGSFNPATSTLSTGGELQYTCSHVLVAGDAPQFPNTATVSGQPPSGAPVSGTDTVVTNLNTPSMTVTKLERDGSSGAFTTGPITAMVGDTIEYEIQVTNTGNTTLALSLNDPHCDAGTIQGPMVISGTLTGNVLSPGGQAQYTCSHVLTSSDVPTFTNVGTITGQPPTGPPISGSGTVVTNVETPGIHVVKLQRDGSAGSFTSSTINATVGDTIEYEIQVTNTGTAPLTLTLSDPHCDAGTISGPTAVSGTLNGNVLSPGGEAQYTCSHVLTAGDASPFTNTATVTGQPPSGPPVSGVGSVTANKQAVSAVTTPLKCTKGKVKKTETKKVHGKKKKVTVCVTKRKVKAKVISRKPIRPAGFTG